ncbi:aminoglycoside phosphotransferase family protein [Streptomyces sp. NPDC049906]|uniref:aminoglycoside phosphotransferase family protein n=1 Tax=Streptomyces sp. NPDC049906 TaxID=3155656 RepID=UPI00344409BD
MVFEAPQRLVRALAGAPADGAPQAAADEAWLGALPALLKEAVDGAGLTVERVRVPGGRSSLVVLVTLADGSPAVCKLAPPGAHPERERAALEHWGGTGAVRVLAGGPAGGGMLLERLRPDVSVRSLPEAKAMLEAAGVLRRLWVAPPSEHPFETVTEVTGRQAAALAAGADAGVEGFDALVTAALEAREGLVAVPVEERLLHGTFRQSKALAGERTPWLAVGPEPVVGDPAYDLARLVRDRVEDLVATASGASAARRRVRRLAESLEVDAERVRGWALFRAVESARRSLARGQRPQAELLMEYATWL